MRSVRTNLSCLAVLAGIAAVSLAATSGSAIAAKACSGGPVCVETLAAALTEARDTLEDVIEPFLIQQGYVMRTARGRMATRSAYLHLGLQPPTRPAASLPLFEEGR